MINIKRMTKTGKEITDLPSWFFQDNRSIFVTGEIDDHAAEEVIQQLSYLNHMSCEPVRLYINSPGGSVSAGLAIADFISLCKCEVWTIAYGQACSMGAFLLSCGTRGKRMASASAEIMIHQPLGGAQGQAVDIQLAAQHIQAVKHKLYSMLSENTGQPYDVIEKDSDRDCFFSAAEAVEYGLIDHVLTADDLHFD